MKDKDKLPSKPGIYWAVSQGKVIYVGMAKDLHSRWNGSEPHHRYSQIARFKNPKLKFKIEPCYRLRYEEARDIQRFKPELNKQFPQPSDHYRVGEFERGAKPTSFKRGSVKTFACFFLAMLRWANA
jgi:hypothetical protein